MEYVAFNDFRAYLVSIHSGLLRNKRRMECLLAIPLNSLNSLISVVNKLETERRRKICSIPLSDKNCYFSPKV